MLRSVGTALALALIAGGCVSAKETGQSAAAAAPTVAPALPREEPKRPGPVAASIVGLRARLVDEETVLGPDRVSWWTRWQLCWAPVPGADSYLVTAVSFEGPGRPRNVAQPCYELTVANGIANRPGGRAGRSQQLSLIAISLCVSIAARFADGTVGPASPDIPVGARYP
jgi:hypothetical protein